MKLDPFSAVKHDTTFRIDPDHTAVLVVDMVNDFLVEGGKMVLPGGYDIVPRQQALIAVARRAGQPIVYVNDAHRPVL